MPQCNVIPQGWLVLVPPSWLNLLIRRLRAREKLALFQTCRGLARHVVASARSIRLCFVESRLGGEVEAQRCVITSLLAGCRNLHVVLCTDQPQPFPVELSNSITEITLALHWRSDGPTTTSFDWNMLHNMHTVTFKKYVSILDISRLCDAVEAGQLTALRSMVWLVKSYQRHAYDAEQSDRPDAVLLRLAATAGKHITQLVVNRSLLALHVGCFTVLESVTVCDFLNKECLEQLCDHPTLQSVTLKSKSTFTTHCQYLEDNADYSQLVNSWETVTLRGLTPKDILALPLTGVKSVRLAHELPPDHFDQAMKGLQRFLAKHSYKLLCVPDPENGQAGTFCLCSCTELELQLLKHIRGVHKLRIGTLKSFSNVPNLYAVVPQCIRCLEIKTCLSEIDTVLVYTNLPVHITHMEFTRYGFDFETLLHLVAYAPAHVRKLTFNWGNTSRDCVVGEWYDVLLATAPAHLSIAFNTWH